MSPKASAGRPRTIGSARFAVWAALAASLALANGCAHAPPPPPPRPKAGYDHRVDELASVDASALIGRRIALDPGHGGAFRGAMGVHGLSEAEVNLAVGLDLKALLEQHGAVVFMTREGDRDFLTPADSSLKADLTERVRLANQFHPDLFVSIHHNADSRGAHDVNETQTYYKLGDEGPSLDAAADVHRYLVRNLSIERYRIMPGNYFVLRSSEGPALLTESSYITNPDVEAKLVLDEKRRLEAEALFLGLAHYFGRPVPEVDTLYAYAPGASRTDTVVASPQPVLSAHIRGAFDGARLTLDGEIVQPSISGDSLWWRPTRPLAVGLHQATLQAWLSAGGYARTRVTRFAVASTPGKVLAEFPGQASWAGDQPLGLRVRVLDAAGLIYRDSVRVRVRDAGTIRVSPADTTLVLPRGEGWVYFGLRSWPRARARRPAPQLTIRATLLPNAAGGSGARESASAHLETRAARRGAPAVLTGMALSMPADTVLRDAPGTTGDDPKVGWINSDGFVCLPRDSTGRLHLPRLAGYRPWATEHGAILAPRDTAEAHEFVPVPAAAPEWPPRFVAIAGGALHGRRIVIDPAGGGDESAGQGVSGARAATLNLQVARALAGFLEAAGAEVKLTREGDFALSDVERVQVSENFRADRFLRIGHAAEPPMIGYYFSSPGGHAWALHARAAFDSLGLKALPLAEDAQYPLQQTSCPALYVSPARVDAPASEERLLSPGALRAEAYALYLSLALEWAPAPSWPRDSLSVTDAAGTPLPRVPVTLGGALVLETDALGRVRFARTEPGPMLVEVPQRAATLRRVLLDFERGVVLSTGSTAR
jgi:N-acetylmuramoyl-L-alanine amidase